MFAVTIIFTGEDNSTKPWVKKFSNITDLSLYLERIPSMPEFTSGILIMVETIPSDHPVLPI